MSKDVKVVKKGGVGKFFLGLFLGIVLGIGAVAGVGFFAYKNLSAKKLRKKFGVEIDLGSDKLNNMVIEDLISNALEVVDKKDTYTINDLEKNFGIEVADVVSGVDITDLKDVGFTKLTDAVKDKLANISAKELEETFNLPESIKTFEFKYYLKDGVLYKDEAKTQIVDKDQDFDYTVNTDNNKVIIKKTEFEVDSTTKLVKNLDFQYLPLEYALDELSNFNDLTLGDLDQLNFDLPNYFDDIDQTTKLSELSNKIQDMYVGDFLNEYNLDKTDPGNIIVKKTADGTVVEGIEATIAKTKIKDVGVTVDELKLVDVFTTSELSQGILSLIPSDTRVDGISNAVAKAIEEKSIGELLDKQVITLSRTASDIYYGEGATEGIKDYWYEISTGEYVQVNTLTVTDLLTVSIVSLKTNVVKDKPIT